MARLLSPIASAIRGSCAGVTYSASKQHPITARQNTCPCRSVTPARTLIKSCFSFAATSWKNYLDDSGRFGWRSYASAISPGSSLVKRACNGRLVFIGTFSFFQYIRRHLGATLVVDFSPPVIPSLLSLDSLSTRPLSVPGTGFSVYIVNRNPVPVYVLFRLSIPYSRGRMRSPGNFPADREAYSAIGSTTAFTYSYKNLIPNRRYFVSCRFITRNPPFRLSANLIIPALSLTFP